MGPLLGYYFDDESLPLLCIANSNPQTRASHRTGVTCCYADTKEPGQLSQSRGLQSGAQSAGEAGGEQLMFLVERSQLGVPLATALYPCTVLHQTASP